MRLLGSIRLSNLTEETTSPERQREAIEHTAKARGDRLVFITEDLDVSGDISPFKRKELGPWLTDAEKIAQWDAIIVAKLDRLSRNLLDFLTFVKWCTENNKGIIVLDPNIDLTTDYGELVAKMLVTFAEWERKIDKKRRSEAAATLRVTGRWGGGPVPFGYEAFQTANRSDPSKTAWYLQPCNGDCPLGLDLAHEVRSAADQIIAGVAVTQIIANWNERGVPTASDAQRLHDDKPSKNRRWLVSSLLSVMRSELLLGYVQHYNNGEHTNPKRVYVDGVPLKREPILDQETWDQVQAALNSRSKPWSRDSIRASLITGVGLCAHCKGTLRKCRTKNGGKGHNIYYQCSNMRNRSVCPDSLSIPMDQLNDRINGIMTGTAELMDYSNVPVGRRVVVTSDREQKLDEIRRAFHDLDDRLNDNAITEDEYDAAHAQLRKLRREISNAEEHEPRVEWVGTGKVIGDIWPGMDDAQKRAFLREHEVKILASRNMVGTLKVAIHVGRLLDYWESMRVATETISA